MKKLYGWYSQQHIDTQDGKEQLSFDSIKNKLVSQKKGVVCTYSTPEGKEVQVTNVTEDKNADSYLWPDKVFVGEVVKCLKSVKYG